MGNGLGLGLGLCIKKYKSGLSPMHWQPGVGVSKFSDREMELGMAPVGVITDEVVGLELRLSLGLGKG